MQSFALISQFSVGSSTTFYVCANITENTYVISNCTRIICSWCYL